MKLFIDTEARVLRHENEGETTEFPLYSPEAFHALTRQWLAVGWTQRYSYGFSWMGRPVIQLPEDLVRIQEVVYRLKPDVIVETGVAHGGSLIFYASLCKAMDYGRVIGIDVEIRPHNRRAIEAHPLARYISLIEGSSTDPTVVRRVKGMVRPGESVLVVLDSCHTRAHVQAELEAYAPLVSKGSYVVAADGIMGDIAGLPGTRPDWSWDNPREAAVEFAGSHPEFVLDPPPFPFNEGTINERVTYWPSAYLRRVA